MHLIRWIGGIALGVGGLAVGGALAAGALAWTRTTRRAARRLRAGAVSGGPSDGPPHQPTAAEDLPAPVARLLARVLPPGRELRTARLRQQGEFLLRPPDGWVPFTATQWVRLHPPAFLWDARMRVAPGLHVRVRDSYLDGVGSMHGAVAGVVTVTRAEGTPEMAEGSLYRYLAEAAWLPSRLVPSDALRWEPADENTARAVLRDGPLEVAVRFDFDEAGDVVGIHVPSRPREVEGRYEPTPWTGRF